MVERTVWFQIRDKVDDSTTLVLTYHPALNLLNEILRKAQKHVLKSSRLHNALPSTARVEFRNTKTIRDKLLRSKLKEFIYKDAGTNVCGNSNCDIYKKNWKWRQFESKVTKKKYRISFQFDGNSCGVGYLLTCLKNYVGSTVARFRLRFNQCKPNIKLNGEGRRGFKQ